MSKGKQSSREKQHAPKRDRATSPHAILGRGAAEDSVRNLQELYTVAVGLALVKAMEVFVDRASEHLGEAAQHVRWADWPALVVLLPAGGRR